MIKRISRRSLYRRSGGNEKGRNAPAGGAGSLSVALLVSLCIHAAGMAAVNIVPPDNLFKGRPFTKVTFLGPILEKTALEIMTGDGDLPGKTEYFFRGENVLHSGLGITPPRVDTGMIVADDRVEAGISRVVRRRLSGKKSSPGVFFGVRSVLDVPGGARMGGQGAHDGRRGIIYRPDPPEVIRGLYGMGESFEVKVRARVDSAGRVVSAGSLTTSGYSALDALAVRYVKGWIFEPAYETGEEEWTEVDVTLWTSGSGG